MQASHCGSFSCCRTWALGHAGFSSFDSWALEHRLSSCGAWVWLFHGMWDLSRLGITPLSPALAGRFFTTEPSGKPSLYAFIQPLSLYLRIHCLLYCMSCQKTEAVSSSALKSHHAQTFVNSADPQSCSTSLMPHLPSTLTTALVENHWCSVKWIRDFNEWEGVRREGQP